MRNLIITEWATWITDLILFAQCFYSGRVLTGLSRRGVSLWAVVFYISAVASFLGAIEHGLHANFDPIFAKNLGQWVILLLSLASMTLGLIFCQSFLSVGPVQSIFKIFLMFKMIFFAWQDLVDPKFLLAVVDYGSALVLLMVAYLLSLRERPGAINFVIAIAFAFLGAGVQILKIAPHPLFNHNDLFHLIQMCSFYYFLQAAKSEHFPLTRTLHFQKT